MIDRCNWRDCPEMGEKFGALNTMLLNSAVRRKFTCSEGGDSKFVFLCPKHLQLAIANLNLPDIKYASLRFMA